MSDVMIKFVVFLILDLALAAGPDGADFVDYLAIEFNRKRNKIGILLDDGLYPR